MWEEGSCNSRDHIGLAVGAPDRNDTRLDAGEAPPARTAAVETSDEPVPVRVVLGEDPAGRQAGPVAVHLDEAAGAAEVLIPVAGVRPDDCVRMQAGGFSKSGKTERLWNNDNKPQRGMHVYMYVLTVASLEPVVDADVVPAQAETAE